jgi:archaetidylinositol phosphate synthase
MDKAMKPGVDSVSSSSSTGKASFRDAQRRHESLLAQAEKKVLIWMAKRLPVWVSPDHLTILGFFSMIGVGLAYRLSADRPAFLILASFLLVVNWFGDSLDGTVARVRQKLRPRYGFYVDHILDAFGTACLLVGLAFSGYMSPLIALGALIAYFLLNIEVYLATYTLSTFHMSFMKFSPTELRILLIVGNTALYYGRIRTTILGTDWLVFDLGGVIGIAGMIIMVIWSTIRHTYTLYREETHT